MPDNAKYGMRWPTNLSFMEIEMEMIRRGGKFQINGQWYGNGLFYHYKELEMLLWPKEKVWHKWNDLQLKSWLESRTMVVLGPSSSGKTNTAATDHLADFYCFPHETTTIICSTTAERLQDRIFGEIKKYHRIARERFPWLPGEPIDSRMRIVTETNEEAVDGRDFRNGIVGVACLQGGQYKGIGNFIGLKNKRVRLLLDELQMLPQAILLAMSNLDKNPDFKGTGLGNPKDTTDALGAMAEPSFSLGGWDGAIDQTPETKTWPTRRPNGICVQLVGTDSPNLDGKLGIPLISQADIDRDVAQYGKDSLQFSMMNQGMMPKGQGSRRVITRHFCQQNKALEKAIWLDSNRTRIAALDAAFKGVGGDRCVLMFGEIGFEPNTPEAGETNVSNLLNQTPSKRSHSQIISIEDIVLVPIDIASPLESEDQIVLFCKEQCSTRRVPASNFFYESGMRASLVSAFGRLWSVDTNPIDCGGPASERQVSAKIEMPCNKYYSKLITEFWFSVRLIIEAKQLRGLTESVMDEGCKREWKMVAGNKIEVESKKDMKEKIGRSPDLFDTLAVMVEGARRLGFVINNKVLIQQPDKDHEWKKKFIKRFRDSWHSQSLNHAA